MEKEKEDIEWPTDVLTRFLTVLAKECDTNAQQAWQKLAFLVSKRAELARFARSQPRPILFRIEFDFRLHDSELVFRIPFTKATVVCVDIDWGDGSVSELREKGAGHVEHKYATRGEYSVRVFPAHPQRGTGAASLDHLGFSHLLEKKEETYQWWRPLREIASLGHCGLRSLNHLFCYCSYFAVDLKRLNTSDICDMSGMFAWSTFNQPIGNWNVSKVTDMSRMFFDVSVFNQPLGDWNVSNVTDMSCMFLRASSFNQPIGNWDVGKVTNMNSMFSTASSFNQPIGGWSVGNVTNMSGIFSSAASFNQPIGGWNVSNVTDMGFAFSDCAAFNQPLEKWDVSKVTNMSFMFQGASAFNQPIGNWNVSNVVDLNGVFNNAKGFNQPIGQWNVSNANTISYLFYGALAFNQPLNAWKVKKDARADQLFQDAIAFDFHQNAPETLLLRSVKK
jgi:surface protein